MKNANIMGVHKKNSIHGELPKRGGGGAWKFAGCLVKNREGVFQWGLIPQCALT